MVKDPYSYSDVEKEELTKRLVELTTQVHGGVYSHRSIDASLLSEIHGEIFVGIRDFAGRFRSASWGTEYLNFGPNRSERRDRVAAKLSGAFDEVARAIRSCDDNPDDPAYEAGAFRIAVYAHARVIQIHPFQDGNGRSGRLLLDIVLLRLGLPPVLLEVPREEYCVALNRFFRDGELRPVEDLLLPCCTFGHVEKRG